MSKVTPYPLRIVKCSKNAVRYPRKNNTKAKAFRQGFKNAMKKGARGDGFPLTIAVTLCLLLIFCGVSEYFRVSIIAHGVRDATQQAVISAMNDNYDDVYHAAREGYAAGWFPTDDGWAECVDEGNVYAALALTLGLDSDGTKYMKYAGDRLEYTLSDLTVSVSNNALASGDSESYTATAAIVLEAPMRLAGSVLPPIRVTLKTQAEYIPKF